MSLIPDGPYFLVISADKVFGPKGNISLEDLGGVPEESFFAVASSPLDILAWVKLPKYPFKIYEVTAPKLEIRPELSYTGGVRSSNWTIVREVELASCFSQNGSRVIELLHNLSLPHLEWHESFRKEMVKTVEEKIREAVAPVGGESLEKGVQNLNAFFLAKGRRKKIEQELAVAKLLIGRNGPSFGVVDECVPKLAQGGFWDLLDAMASWALINGDRPNPFWLITELIRGDNIPSVTGDQLISWANSAKSISVEQAPKSPAASNIEARIKELTMTPGKSNGRHSPPLEAPPAPVWDETGKGSEPSSKLTDETVQKLLNMEAELSKRIIGQREAIVAMTEMMRARYMQLKDPRRPDSAVFLGPSGVGKTELAKALAEYLDRKLVIIDLGEYQAPHTVSRLFGAPPGYLGHEKGGQLTNALIKNPNAIVLFDESDKAHPTVLDALLQTLDEGRMTDGKGRQVDFSRAAIIVSANYGSSEINQEQSRRHKIGFEGPGDNQKEHSVRQRVREAAIAGFEKDTRTEFRGRVDLVVVFDPLTDQEIERIVVMRSAEMTEEIFTRSGIKLDFTPQALRLISNTNRVPGEGARHVRKALEKLVAGPLGTLLLRARAEKKPITRLQIDESDAKIIFTEQLIARDPSVLDL